MVCLRPHRIHLWLSNAKNAIMIRREVSVMRCSYKDDFVVDYSSGALQITKGEGVDLLVSASKIPAGWKAGLDSAVSSKSCHELRAAAKGVTESIERAFEIE